MVHVAPFRVSSFFKQTVLIPHLVYDCFYHESMSRQVVKHKTHGILFHGSTMNLDLLGFPRLRESGGPFNVPSKEFFVKGQVEGWFEPNSPAHWRLWAHAIDSLWHGVVWCNFLLCNKQFCKGLLQLLEVLWFTGFFCLGILFNHMVCITTNTKGGIVVRSLQPSKKQQNWSGLSCHLLIVIPIYESHYFLSTSLGMLDGMGCKNAQQHRHLFRRKTSIKILAL